MSMNKTYIFQGDVQAGKYIHSSNIRMTTWAPSLKKARSNLEYRYRKDYDIPFAVPLYFRGVIGEHILEDEKQFLNENQVYSEISKSVMEQLRMEFDYE